MKKILLVVLSLLICTFFVFAGGDKEGETKAPFEERFRDMSWDEIVAEAEGQSVYFYMWGGSDLINKFVTEYMGGRLKEEYNIDLKMVPVTGPQVYINKVMSEKQAGKHTGGSVDLVWINGENFKTMMQGDLLFGPFDEELPNIKYVDLDNPVIAIDFGKPTEGYESPYAAGQMVIEYDSAKVPNPPTTIDGLVEWIKANPGKFTYPSLPDFTGTAFLTHFLYHVAGGYEMFQEPFNQATFDKVGQKLWDLLNEIEPYLWRKGETYPEDKTKLDMLFANGEVYYGMSYGPSEAASKILNGQYPDSIRTFVLDSGTVANVNYVAIPYNSSNKAAAMVLANLILDPATQYNMALPKQWGTIPTLDMSKVPDEWLDKFNAIPRHESVLSPEVLSAHTLPTLPSDWLLALEEGWTNEIQTK